MPELPEVETYKRHLDATALHRGIHGVQCEAPGMLAGVSLRALKRALEGHQLERSHRHGKYLFAALDQGAWLVLHFGMTGRLAYIKDNQEPPPYTRLCLLFDNGDRLAYVAQRKLGHIGLTKDVSAFIAAHKLGTDALAVDLKGFREHAREQRATAKTWLMDQSVFAGIGNVYSDEMLFQARLHPKRKVAKLSDEELKRLFHKLKAVLGRAIKEKANAAELPRSYLLHHRGEGETCPRCRGRIEKLTVSGRGSYYCSQCQPQAA